MNLYIALLPWASLWIHSLTLTKKNDRKIFQRKDTVQTKTAERLDEYQCLFYVLH